MAARAREFFSVNKKMSKIAIIDEFFQKKRMEISCGQGYPQKKLPVNIAKEDLIFNPVQSSFAIS